MKEHSKMTRAELLARIRELEDQDTTHESAGSENVKRVSEQSDSEERLRALLETAVEGIVTIDERGIVESMNPAAEQIFGYPATAVIGKNVSLLMPSPYREAHDEYMGNYLRTGRAKIIGIGREVVGQRKDGTIFPMDLAVSEVKLSDRRLFTGFVRDITERKKAEAQLHLVRSAIEQGFSAVLITDADLPDPRVVYINPTFAQVTGYAPERILGQRLSSLSNLRTVQQRLREGVPEGLRVIEQISSYSSPQGERLGEWRVGPVQNKEGRNTHWLVIFRDITERKRLEREILEISDQERRRIGQDLHDGLCQHLAGIELMSQVLEQKLAARSKTDAARAGEIARHVREAISQTRSLARGLSPVTLESEGLATGLEELAANTEKMFGVSCQVECPLPVQVNPMSAATHLYRIAQEAVSNAIKHGKSSKVVIRLEPDGSNIRLSVLDNGSGFSQNASRKNGMGLHIMRYRTGMLGGILTIEQNPAGGIRVVCLVPQNPNSRQPELVSI